jgi:HlyD family secretion protein
MNIQNIKKYIGEHKKMSWFIIILIILGGWYGYSKYKSGISAETKYVISDVKKGSVISSVSGSGQVSSSNEVSIKSQTSGDIVSVNVTVGQAVQAGDLIASVDARDARISLENAKINMEKLTNSNSTSLLQNNNSLSKAYETGYNTVVSTNSDFPSIINGMDNLLYTQTGYLSDTKIQSLSDSTKNLRNTAGVLFDSAKRKQSENSLLYQKTSRTSSNNDIEYLISNTYDTVKQLTEALKNARSAVEYIKNQEIDRNATDATTAETNLDSWINKMNTDLSSLLTSKTNIAETKNSLTELNKGTNSLDVRAQRLSLESAQLAYDNSFIRAPFDGVVAQLTVHIGDNVSNGTALGTFITQQKVADITLNEVDVAKIKIGNKTTLTFDAIEGLQITGKVSSIDLVGTVSQGVVSYPVKIVFDTQDDRIKSGMSVSASIITEAKQDIVIVPTSAIKSQNNVSYVDTVSKETIVTDSSGTTLATTPTQQQVELGISDDTNTEIISGLNVGDKIVTKTIAGTGTVKATTAPSLFGGGGNTRAMGR